MTYPSIITIDGPAASGKTTVGERLARRLGYLFFDTGIMYRAVTWAAINKLGSANDESAVTEIARTVHIDIQPPSVVDNRKCDVLVDAVDVTWAIRTQEVEDSVSIASAYKNVRAAMSAQQRRIGKRGHVVMVGRDIGTVVLPEAELKIFLDASLETRARRRFDELIGRGLQANYMQILRSMRRRDRIDTNRTVAPLKPALDAITINTDALNVDQVTEVIWALIAQ